jgi:hypothetical protein
VRLTYPLPRIQNIFHRRRGYKYLTKIDLTLCFYTYMLNDESSWYCVIVTPFGKFRYLQLPMGFTNSPSWAQAVLEEIFDNVLREIECFIDDIGIFNNNWDRHLFMINLVLTQLEEHGSTVNPQKCKWAVAETNWLGYWMTPTVLKPWQKKIEPILALAPPKTIKQLCSFIGMINFYRDMWQHCAHILTPLTALMKVPKSQFNLHWNAECDRAFAAVKAMICHEVLLTYPDPNLFYDIETDASDKQLSAVIYQAQKPIAFFSRKLTSAQTWYPTIYKETLSILETLQEFCPLLWGSKIQIFMDHIKLDLQKYQVSTHSQLADDHRGICSQFFLQARSQERCR